MTTMQSRSARAERTQARILDATLTCLIRSGYQGTTTSAVQTEAGVSRGALMHHYPSKIELMVAAVRHLARSRAENLRTLARSLPRGPQRVGQAIDLLWETFEGPLFAATMELWTASRTDAELRDALHLSERALRVDLFDVMEELFGADLAAQPRFAEAIEMTLQFMRGAAMTSVLRQTRERQADVIKRWKTLFVRLVDGEHP